MENGHKKWTNRGHKYRQDVRKGWVKVGYFVSQYKAWEEKCPEQDL
jgi:hypothetical protein